MSTLAIAEVTTSTRTDITFPTSVQKLRAVTLCTAFAPVCGYDIITSKPLGDVFCPNTKCSGKLCLPKKNFESLGRSDYQCPQYASVCARCAIFLFWKSNKFLFLDVWRRDFSISKRRKNDFNMLLEMCMVQDAQTKSVLTFQSTKLPVSTTAKSARSALMCWLVVLRTKNR